MSLLLNPRVWIALAFAAFLAFTNFASYRKGKNDVRMEWQVSVAQANEEARRLEQRRQDRASEAAQLAAVRDARIRADAASARSAASGLRDDLESTRKWAEQSRAAADKALGVTSDLLGRCTALYLGVAEDAARADSEARELRQAWPK